MGALLAAMTAAFVMLALADSAQAYIYWANQGGLGLGTTISRSNLDGSGVNGKFIDGARQPCGVAVDRDHVYWMNMNTTTMGRANLDGTGVNQRFVDPAGGARSNVCGVVSNGAHIYWSTGSTIGRVNADGSHPNPAFMDREACGQPAVGQNHIYWAGFSAIGRANLDGSGADPNFISNLDQACDVAVDGQHIYWGSSAEPRRGSIGRASLDGSGVNKNLVSDVSPCGLALDDANLYMALPGDWDGSIARANLDGTGLTVLAPSSPPCGIAVNTDPPLGKPGGFKLKLKVKRPQTSLRRVRLKTTCSGADCRAVARGALRVKHANGLKRISLGKDTRSLKEGVSRSLVLKIGGSARAAARRALANGRRVTVRTRVRAHNRSGGTGVRVRARTVRVAGS